MYPEEIAVTADLDYFVMNGMQVPPRRRGRANFAMADAVHEFPNNMNLALSFVEALEVVHQRDPEVVGRGAVPAAPAGSAWRVVSRGGLLAPGQPVEERGLAHGLRGGRQGFGL